MKLTIFRRAYGSEVVFLCLILLAVDSHGFPWTSENDKRIGKMMDKALCSCDTARLKLPAYIESNAEANTIERYYRHYQHLKKRAIEEHRGYHLSKKRREPKSELPSNVTGSIRYHDCENSYQTYQAERQKKASVARKKREAEKARERRDQAKARKIIEDQARKEGFAGSRFDGVGAMIASIKSGAEDLNRNINWVVCLGGDDKSYQVDQVVGQNIYFRAGHFVPDVKLVIRNTTGKTPFEDQQITAIAGFECLVFKGLKSYTTVTGAIAQAWAFEPAF